MENLNHSTVEYNPKTMRCKCKVCGEFKVPVREFVNNIRPTRVCVDCRAIEPAIEHDPITEIEYNGLVKLADYLIDNRVTGKLFGMVFGLIADYEKENVPEPGEIEFDTTEPPSEYTVKLYDTEGNIVSGNCIIRATDEHGDFVEKNVFVPVEGKETIKFVRFDETPGHDYTKE